MMLDHAGHTVSTRQHEPDHTDHTDHTDYTDRPDQECFLACLADLDDKVGTVYLSNVWTLVVYTGQRRP